MNNSSILRVEALGFQWKAQDPFLFCTYHKDDYPKGNENLGLDAEYLTGRNIGQDFISKNGFRMYHGSMVPGFPYHPHRGFETITISVKGAVDHSDSYGGAGRFKGGDVQWLTAGKGIQHSEMFPLLNSDKDNPFELFQIWLNLPSKSKFAEPHYKMIWKENVPVVKVKDSNGKVTEVSIIVGTLNEINAPEPAPDSWAADPQNEVAVYTIKMEAGSTWTIPNTAELVNRNLYFYKGKTISIDQQTVKDQSLITLNSKEETTIVNGSEEAFLLLLQGKPIEEKVVQYGPFVMNTEQEIRDTISDYQKTQFGGWPWPMKEQVWDKAKGRFAIFADGTEEEK
ncbi:pirin family protein [Plebeiibacterium sediminum]|uniref:Pirin family protein n=1 Tax=Plebeiibacterium sediminum TaxID=2992112 RepID=A0AAE3SH87_9BACT|nr:pirin family protein [Plebeiobacterium sediminum]MCW3789315.1 pirin family protein [Plebeiobacterium sediminum]